MQPAVQQVRQGRILAIKCRTIVRRLSNVDRAFDEAELAGYSVRRDILHGVYRCPLCVSKCKPVVKVFVPCTLACR